MTDEDEGHAKYHKDMITVTDDNSVCMESPYKVIKVNNMKRLRGYTT